MTTAHTLDVKPSITDGRITIAVTLDNATLADLVILSSTGATVETLMRRWAEKGDYTFTTDLKGQAGSAFFVVLRTNEGMLYRKVVLAR